MLTFLASPAAAQSDNGTTSKAELKGGQRDFDFEFGAWTVHLKRRLRPLTGSTEWVEYSGTSVVRRVWNGNANLGELEVDGPAGHIEGLSLRLYNPDSRQWHISWANSRDGLVGPAMIGGFVNGRGEFYNQESLNGKAIFVRFIFSDITANTFKLEQAFSDDGGKTWEANWLASFRRTDGQTD
jgi:hypothetical protein